MPTMHDVARMAGTSVATVSNYINKTRPVSRKLSARIAEAVETLSYVPNQAAKILKSNVNRTIGVILPNIQDNYYVQIYEGLEVVLTKRGYHPDLFITRDIPDIEQQYIFELIRDNVCGLFLITAQPENTDFFERNLVRRNLPFVHMDRKIEGCDAPFLSFDNKATVGRFMQNFSDKKKFILFCGSEQYSCENAAAEGFGPPSDNKKIVRIPLNKESAFRATIAHLSRFHPDVIITTDTLITTGVMEGLALLNYTDVEIATLGEDTWTNFSYLKNVTVMSRTALQAGEECARLLLQAVEGKERTDPPINIMWESKSIVGSVKQLQMPHIHKPKIKVALLDTLPIRQFEGLVASFSKDVSLTKIPHRDMLATIYNGDADVVMYDLPWFYSLAQDGLLADVTEMVGGINQSAYLKDHIRVFGEFGGRYYGMPFLCSPQVLFYRNDIFSDPAMGADYYKKYGFTLRPPKTWTEFNKVSEFFSKKLNPHSPVQWGTCVCAAYAECLSPEIYMRLWAYGGKMFDGKGKIIFNTGNTIKAYQSLYDTLEVSADNCRQKNDFNVVEDFLSGELAMLITYPPFMSETSELYKKCRIGQIGFTHIPGRTPILGGWGLGVTTGSSKKEAAMKFIRWACGEEIANYLVIIAGQSVLNKVFSNNELITLYPWLPLYKAAYDYAEPLLPPVKHGRVIITQNEIDHIIADNLYALMEGKLTVEETVYNTERQLSERCNRK